MTLEEKVRTELVFYMKLGVAQHNVNVARAILVELEKYKKENRGELTPKVEQSILQSMLKQRNESFQIFEKAGRDDLANIEDIERCIIVGYMNKAATEKQLQKAVSATMNRLGSVSMKDMGKIMKMSKELLEDYTVNGKILSDIVKKKLEER